MKKYALIFPLLVAAVLISGCATTPYDGSPPKVDQSRIDTVTVAATAWLASDQGKDMFSVGNLANPVAVFDENRTLDHWVLPVKDDQGMYLGYFIAKSDSFITPMTAMKYPDPRHNLFSKSREDAYSEMLENHIYLSDQVREPYISIVAGKGYAWTSEVVINGKKIGTLYVFISIIDPSDADNRLVTPA